MAYTYMQDVKNGSQVNGGDSWTVTLTSTDGAANGTTTFTSATGGFTGMEGRWMWIQGKNVQRRIVTVGSDTSVTLHATVVAGTGLTFIIGGPVKYLDRLTATMAAGDSVRVAKTPDATSLGTCTWTNGSGHVTAATANNKHIENMFLRWVPSANVTTAAANIAKVLGVGATMTTAAGFTTGLVAYQKLYKTFQGGTASAASTYSTYAASRACDMLTGTNYYWRNNNSLPTWWKYDFGDGNAKTLTEYGIYGSGTQNDDPYDWVFQGSNDDDAWTDLDTLVDTTLTQNQINWFTIDSPDSYRYYRLYVTDAYGAGNYIGLGEMVYNDGVHDFSSYEQVSFMWYCASAVASGVLSVRLCSDDAGTTAVDTLTINEDMPSNLCIPIVIDKGSALGSSIKSVAIYAESDPGAISNITAINMVACKADGTSGALTHQCAIGHNGVGDTWFAISGILDQGATWDIQLEDAPNGAYANTYVKYYDKVTGDYTTYMMEPHQYYRTESPYTALTDATAGSVGNVITISGGWDTSLGTQTGITVLHTTRSTAIMNISGAYKNVSKIALIRGGSGTFYSANGTLDMEFVANPYTAVVGFTIQGNDITATSKSLVSLYGGWEFVSAARLSFTSTYNVYAFNTYAHYTIGSTVNSSTITGGKSFGTCNRGIYLASGSYNVVTVEKIWGPTQGVTISSGYHNIIEITDTFSCTGIAFSLGGAGNIIRNSNAAAASSCTSLCSLSSYVGDNYLINCDFSGLTVTHLIVNGDVGVTHLKNCTLPTYTNRTSSIGPGIITNFDNNTSGANWQSRYEGLLETTDAVRHTASGYAWKLSFAIITYITAARPVRFKIASFLLVSGSTYTITGWFRRSNTGLTLKMVYVGGQIAGDDADVSASMTEVADTWEQLSIELTPSETGVVDIELWGYTANSAYVGYVDDLAVSVT